MIYALDPRTTQKIQAAPNLEGVCPFCWGELLPHCGEILVWHWKHKRREGCDAWGEPETLWHRQWKRRFPSECAEVRIERGDEVHIADVHLPNDTTIEFQHSPISPDQIHERERFYGRNLTWVFDAREFIERLDLNPPTADKPYWSFRWKHPRKTIGMTVPRCFLDLGYPKHDQDEELPWDITPSAHRLFHMRSFYESPCAGWGEMISCDEFLRRIGAPPP